MAYPHPIGRLWEHRSPWPEVGFQKVLVFFYVVFADLNISWNETFQKCIPFFLARSSGAYPLKVLESPTYCGSPSYLEIKCRNFRQSPAVRGRGRRRLRCACWLRMSIMGLYYVFMNASCADDQNLKIVRCSTFQGRWYLDFWAGPKNPL